MLDASDSDRSPDLAVVFYETFAGKTEPMELQLFYTASSEDDAARLKALLENLKQ